MLNIIKYFRGYAWEQKLTDGIDVAKPYWNQINVFLNTVRTQRLEHLKVVLYPLRYLFLTGVLMCIFLGGTSMSSDWVRAKPWAGPLGVLFAGLGSLAGIGLVCFLGVPLIGMTSTVPFIMVGKYT